MFQCRKNYAVLSLVIFCIEVYIAMYVKDGIIRPYIGDFLVVIFLYCLLRCFIKISILHAAISVFIFATIIEILQYFNWVQWFHLEHNVIARIVMGTSFEWLDILAYALGTVAIIIIEHVIRRKKGE